ncbi:HD domain-containing phosphohydrolase [Vibrio tapetis]|uniref:Chemotactic transducer-like protein n=1 Tax=Vibrio tapetis subsp. tapetis TaxID=1671868 RepID=A0A2N8ZIN4_9VIBR|nr:HD domain-containing phosphohydrolase [Vibrio tapetis]SON51775.1 Chemotactic transducer-like protein [Vibrio tapetis subsp. tapetis]
MTRHRRHSLRFYITLLFIFAAVSIGSVLISVSYLHSQKLLAVTALELSGDKGEKLESAFKLEVAPVLNTLDMLASSALVEYEGAPVTQGHWLNSLYRFFEKTPSVTSLFYASDDGHFTLFRPIPSHTERERLSAPEESKFMLSHTDPKGQMTRLFYDSQLKVLGQITKEASTFVPEERSWFSSAKRDGIIRLTEPYEFYMLEKHGVTLSRRSLNGKAVLGIDFTLGSLSTEIAENLGSEHSVLALFDQKFKLIAHKNLLENEFESGALNVPSQSVLGDMTFEVKEVGLDFVSFEGETWARAIIPVELSPKVTLFLVEAIPQNMLIQDILSLRNKQVFAAIIMLSVGCVFVFLISKRISKPLENLAKLTQNITHFKFKKKDYPDSQIKEVDELTSSVKLMEHALDDFLHLLKETSQNHDFSVLANKLIAHCYTISHAHSVNVFIKDQGDNAFCQIGDEGRIPFDIMAFFHSNDADYQTLKSGDIVKIDDGEAMRWSLFPILNKAQQLVVVLALNEQKIGNESDYHHSFLKQVLNFAGIAKENIDQIQQQKDMLNAFIELTASAIDTKSPYTGGHCQRVPMLTEMLVKAVVDDEEFYPDFEMTELEWEELMLAAWLHDCGKVTTPEYVVDKATKLETIYDRIHEVRMRFELLKSEAEVEYWKNLHHGMSEQQAEQIKRQKQQELDSDFEFIAHCNLGSEWMSEEALKRLSTISERKWTRTIDDRLGLSWAEVDRMADPEPLPVEECILADKQAHHIAWDQRPELSEAYTMRAGKYKYDRGELYNLSTRAGTLTEEERYIINDHIVQTIEMLNKLPYPPHLSGVPIIAGGHHERVDGQGYPMGIKGDEFGLSPRVMAIADIFEALTSSDRPYKKAKTLEESIGILTHMATSGHIDPQLFLIFLTQDVYLDYANKFLPNHQIESFDKSTYMAKVRQYIESTGA